MVLSGLGRPRFTSKFGGAYEYLNKYIFPLKDLIESLKRKERKKEKEFQAAYNTRILHEQKLQRAYEGLEHFRK